MNDLPKLEIAPGAARVRTVLVPSLVPESPNVWLRLHWTSRRRHTRRWAEEIWIASACVRRPSPFRCARITIERFALAMLDPDNLVASVKPILDVLQPASRRHPFGLGWIAGDDPSSIELVVRQTRVSKRSLVGTAITVEELHP